MRRAGRAIPRLCSKTFPIEIALLESFQAVRDLVTIILTGVLVKGHSAIYEIDPSFS
jgi:hypothetical protein